jgi:hypothetical protein
MLPAVAIGGLVALALLVRPVWRALAKTRAGARAERIRHVQRAPAFNDPRDWQRQFARMYRI